MKPRILILENAIAVTGGLNSAIRSSRALSGQFEFIFVLPSASSAIAAVRKSGFEVHTIPFVELKKSVWVVLIYLPALLINTIRLFRIIRKTRVSVITGNDFYNLTPAFYKMLGGTLPYICFVRFLPSRFSPWLVNRWMNFHQRYASSIIAVSQAVKNELPISEKLTIIFESLPAEGSDFNYGIDSRTILYLANYIQGKGQDHAIRAFAQIHHDFPAWNIEFAGGDMDLSKNKAYRISLEKLAVDLGISDQVVWRGAVSDVPAIFQECSFTVNFSDSESFSLTCLESLWAGRPVIASRSGGPSEIVDEGMTGLLVPVGDIDAMAGAMRKLMSDAVLREGMARNGFKEVRVKFDAAKTSRKLADVYFPLVRRDKEN